MSATKTARPTGRPPSFTGTGGTSTTKVRLRLTRAQWQSISTVAESQGKSFREFLRQRLLKAVADVMDGGGLARVRKI